MNHKRMEMNLKIVPDKTIQRFDGDLPSKMTVWIRSQLIFGRCRCLNYFCWWSLMWDLIKVKNILQTLKERRWKSSLPLEESTQIQFFVHVCNYLLRNGELFMAGRLHSTVMMQKSDQNLKAMEWKCWWRLDSSTYQIVKRNNWINKANEK